VTPDKHPLDRIENRIQFPAYVLVKKAQHEVAVLLQQLILPSIAPIRDRIREMLSAIQFDGQTRVGAQQVDFKRSEAVEGDRQRHVETEEPIRLPQRLQSSIERRFRCTSCPRCTLGVLWSRPRGVHEQAR